MDALEIVSRLLGGGVLVLLTAFFVAIRFGLTRPRQYPDSARYSRKKNSRRNAERT
ncbi:hypothetical protein [Haloterrigena salifodinae]|uniref:hypothetical protein n=1 Tax=Haloterrigena salifodinae TaxID=2675099 RepID=UPI0013DE7CA9|nr:hypothetical protein [Haloterrigena salifodinae]